MTRFLRVGLVVCFLILILTLWSLRLDHTGGKSGTGELFLRVNGIPSHVCSLLYFSWFPWKTKQSKTKPSKSSTPIKEFEFLAPSILAVCVHLCTWWPSHLVEQQEILGVTETRAATWKEIIGYEGGTLKVPWLKLFGSLKLEDVQGQVKGYYLRCLL